MEHTLIRENLIQPGVDFPGFFQKDNYTVRHTTGHNMFDPESFITGEEMARGMTYSNSARVYHSHQDYVDAVTGVFTLTEISQMFPRELILEREEAEEEIEEPEYNDDNYDEYPEENPYAGSIDPNDY